MNDSLPYIAALSANILFAFASLMYAHYAQKFSVLWMNTFKAGISLLGSAAAVLIFVGFHLHGILPTVCLLLSGFVGLNLADLFLLTSFKRIGPARTLMLFGFHPVFLGIASYFLFQQSFDTHRLVALIFLLGCLFIFSWERYQSVGSWEIAGLLGALGGVCLDATGVLLTRYSYQVDINMTPIEGHLWRCIGAMVGFGVISIFRPIQLLEHFKSMPNKEQIQISVGAFFGTFISLLFGLYAYQKGHMATLSAISVTSPIFAATFESIYHKRRPTRPLLAALASFIIGFLILIFW